MAWPLKGLPERVWALAVLVLLIFGAPGAGWAETRLALVIANGEYRSLPNVPVAHQDAAAMGEFLTSAGFAVTTLLDGSREQMLQALRQLGEKHVDAVRLVFYVGRAAQVGGENYLVPVDGSERELTGAVRLAEVTDALRGSAMSFVIVNASRAAPPGARERANKIEDVPENSIVAFSTAPGSEVIFGDGPLSIYTEAFVEIGRRPGIPIERVLRDVRRAVHTRTGGRMTPWEGATAIGEFCFFGCP